MEDLIKLLALAVMGVVGYFCAVRTRAAKDRETMGRIDAEIRENENKISDLVDKADLADLTKLANDRLRKRRSGSDAP